jgi:hypothetical protein
VSRRGGDGQHPGEAAASSDGPPAPAVAAAGEATGPGAAEPGAAEPETAEPKPAEPSHPTGAAAPTSGRAPLVFDDLAGPELSVVDVDEEPAPRRRKTLLPGILAVLLGLGVLVTTALTSSPRTDEPAPMSEQVPGEELTAPAEDGGPEEPALPGPAGTAPDGPPAQGPGLPEEAGGGGDEAADGSFTLIDAGVLPPGATTPQGSAAEIGSTDALRVAVAYTGAEGGVELTAAPGLPADLAPPRSVTLSSQRSGHVFVWPAPPDGWPLGRHQVELRTGDELAGLITVTVR